MPFSVSLRLGVIIHSTCLLPVAGPGGTLPAAFSLPCSPGSVDICGADICGEEDAGSPPSHHREPGLWHCEVSPTGLERRHFSSPVASVQRDTCLSYRPKGRAPKGRLHMLATSHSGSRIGISVASHSSVNRVSFKGVENCKRSWKFKPFSVS